MSTLSWESVMRPLGRKAREWHRAVLHQLVGHVLALRQTEEAPGRLIRSIIRRLEGHMNQMHTYAEH
jgi:hypothetical protein